MKIGGDDFSLVYTVALAADDGGLPGAALAAEGAAAGAEQVLGHVLLSIAEVAVAVSTSGF